MPIVSWVCFPLVFGNVFLKVCCLFGIIVHVHGVFCVRPQGDNSCTRQIQANKRHNKHMFLSLTRGKCVQNPTFLCPSATKAFCWSKKVFGSRAEQNSDLRHEKGKPQTHTTFRTSSAPTCELDFVGSNPGQYPFPVLLSLVHHIFVPMFFISLYISLQFVCCLPNSQKQNQGCAYLSGEIIQSESRTNIQGPNHVCVHLAKPAFCMSKVLKIHLPCQRLKMFQLFFLFKECSCLFDGPKRRIDKCLDSSKSSAKVSNRQKSCAYGLFVVSSLPPLIVCYSFDKTLSSEWSLDLRGLITAVNGNGGGHAWPDMIYVHL